MPEQSSFLRRKEREDECSDARAFFCCGSKALWPQRLWGAIRAKSPQMWLWAGDAVYLGGDQPSSLEEAFNAQLQQEVASPNPTLQNAPDSVSLAQQHECLRSSRTVQHALFHWYGSH